MSYSNSRKAGIAYKFMLLCSNGSTKNYREDIIVFHNNTTMKNNTVTYDLAEFDNREISEAADLLKAYADGNYRYDTTLGSGVKVGFNKNFGKVWLEDEDYQCFMLNDERLEPFLFTPYNGEEGFIEELVEIYEDLHLEDKEFVREQVRALNFPLTEEQEKMFKNESEGK